MLPVGGGGVIADWGNSLSTSPWFSPWLLFLPSTSPALGSIRKWNSSFAVGLVWYAVAHLSAASAKSVAILPWRGSVWYSTVAYPRNTCRKLCCSGRSRDGV